ncbi:MAG: hypothetical protein ACOVOQ_09065 [Flavobacterium sp.]|jgi:hypothetical protein
MIKIISFFTMLFSLSSAFAQKDLIDRLLKQEIEIDSLKKIVRSETDIRQILKKENNSLQDSVKNLNTNLANLEEVKKSKKIIDSILKHKIDSIVLLKKGITEIETQITIERQKSDLKAKEENDKGKNEILSIIVNRYKDQSFDELIKSSTKQSVLQDLMLFKNQSEITQILSELQIYFIAKELIDAKLDITQIQIQEKQLSLNKKQSAELEKIKKIISNYQTFNDGLKQTLGNIIALDEREVVSGNKEIQKKKFDKILAELSSYIFNYGFTFSDYPYLSNIILELIKRKQPNADAEISDLLKKL